MDGALTEVIVDMAIDITGGDFMDVPSMAEPLFLFPFTTGQTTAEFLYFAMMLA